MSKKKIGTLLLIPYVLSLVIYSSFGGVIHKLGGFPSDCILTALFVVPIIMTLIAGSIQDRKEHHAEHFVWFYPLVSSVVTTIITVVRGYVLANGNISIKSYYTKISIGFGIFLVSDIILMLFFMAILKNLGGADSKIIASLCSVMFTLSCISKYFSMKVDIEPILLNSSLPVILLNALFNSLLFICIAMILTLPESFNQVKNKEKIGIPLVPYLTAGFSLSLIASLIVSQI